MLGDISAQKFLQRYWQREPLLIRKALIDYRSPISPDELAGLALETEVESRLVEGKAKDWSLRHGPFTEQDFLQLPEFFPPARIFRAARNDINFALEAVVLSSKPPFF